MRKYRIQPYDGAVTLLPAEEGFRKLSYREDLGWTPYCRSAPQIHLIPGDHLTVLSAPHARRTAEIVLGLLG